jgi:uncharacterized protein
MSECLCDQCVALCCRYFALPIDNPKTAKEYDDIRWYLLHESVVIFVEKKQWYLGVLTRCKHLQKDNRCGIYETRPTICRNYVTDNCDYHGGEYDFQLLFTSAEQLRRYAVEKLKKSGRWNPREGETELLGPGHPRFVGEAPRVLSLPILRNIAKPNGAANGSSDGGDESKGDLKPKIVMPRRAARRPAPRRPAPAR